MSYKNQRNKQEKEMSMAMKIVCVVLALVLIAAAVLMVLQFCTPYKPTKWFGETETQSGTPTDKEPEPSQNQEPSELHGSDDMIAAIQEAVAAQSSLVLTSSEDSASELGTFAATRLTKETLVEEYGIEEYADSGLQLKITNIEPTYATDKTVTWSVVRTDGNTGFEHAISVVPSEDTLSALVVCEAIVPVQLDIVATFNSNPDLKLICTCDFLDQYDKVHMALMDLSANPARPADKVEYGNQNIKSYEPRIYNMSGTGQYILHSTSEGTIDCVITTKDKYTLSITGTTATDLVPLAISPYCYSLEFQTSKTLEANLNSFYSFVSGGSANQQLAGQLCTWVTNINKNGEQGVQPYQEAMGKILKIQYGIVFQYEYDGQTFTTEKSYTDEIGCSVSVPVTSAELSQGSTIFQK